MIDKKSFFRLAEYGTVVEERSEWKGRRDGAQASCSERLNQRFFLLGVYGSLFEESESRKLLRDLVAGVGFEPTTFGL